MSVLELVELKNSLEEEWGVTAAAPVAVAAVGAPAGGGDGGAAEEKDSFDVVLTGAGDKKIQVIKVVRAATGLGPKEAKDLVDAAPGNVQEALTKSQAQKPQAPREKARPHGWPRGCRLGGWRGTGGRPSFARSRRCPATPFGIPTRRGSHSAIARPNSEAGSPRSTAGVTATTSADTGHLDPPSNPRYHSSPPERE